METITILGFYISILFLEALTDVFTYKGWTTHEQKFGGLAHIFQKLLILAVFIFGCWISVKVTLNFKNICILILTYCMINFSFFDLFYNFILGQNTQGKTAYWDLLLSKLNINSIGVIYNFVRLIVAFIACYILVRL